MERKTGIWLIVLAVLLVAAIVIGVVFKTQLSSKETELAAAQSGAEELNAQIAEKDAAQATLAEQIAAKDAELASLNASIEEKTALLTEHESNGSQLQAQIDTLTAEAAAAAEQIETLKAEAAAANAQVETLKAEAEAAATQISDSEAQLSEANKTLAENEVSMEEFGGNLAAGNAYAASLESELTQSRSLVAELTKASESGDKADVIAVLEKEIADANVTLNSLKSQIVELQAKVEQDKQQAGTDVSAQDGSAAAPAAEPEKTEPAATAAEPEKTESDATAAEPEKAEPDATAAEPEKTKPDATAEPDSALADAIARAEAAEARLAQLEADYAAAQTQLDAAGDAVAQGAASTESIYRQMAEILSDDSGKLSDEEKLAALKGLEGELQGYVASLSAAADEIADQKTALEGVQTTLSGLEADLSAANETVASLESQIDQGNATITDLQSDIADKTGRIADLESEIAAAKEQLTQGEADSADKAAKLDALNEELTGLNGTVTDLKAQLDDQVQSMADLKDQHAAAIANYEKKLAEMNAYRISRDIVDGEAYSATETSNAIAFAADGVTGSWSFTNAALSGNSVTIEISLNNEVIYTSQPIAPGESLNEIVLTAPLAAGTYDAVAATKTYDAEGNYVSGTRTPVTLTVAG